MPRPFIIDTPGQVPDTITKEVTVTSFALMTGIKIDPSAFAFLYPYQVAGLTPLNDCDSDECREICIEYYNLVFGGSNGQRSSYENDVTALLLNDESHPQFLSSSITFTLQRRNRNTWVDESALTSVFGTNYAFGSLPGHDNYRGFLVNWGSVLFQAGPGCYRIKAERSVSVTITERTDSFNLTFPGAVLIPGLAISVTNGQTIQVFFSTTPTAAQVEAALNAHPQSIAYGLTYDVTFSTSRVDIDVTGNAQVYASGITLYTGFIGAPFTNEGYMLFEGQSRSIDWCVATEAFTLRAFNCDMANGTVKFETAITGQVGDKRVDYLVYDYTGFTWNDSIRLQGYFGEERIAEYLEVNNEWGPPKMGLIQKVKDEAISEFTFYSKVLPKALHERLMTYGVMANEIRVSDYNLFNSDYNIKRLLVVKAGNYVPEYFDKNGARVSKVAVPFRRGVQSSIKVNC